MVEIKTKSKLQENALREFKHRVNYKINESAKYRPLVGIDEEFDDLPDVNEVGDHEEAPKVDGGETPTEPSNGEAVNTKAPVPSFDAQGGGEMPPAVDAPPMGGDPTVIPPMGGMGEPPVQQVDDIQNEIIKHNIEAMKAIHDQLDNLNTLTQSLNAKLDGLNAEVEEVREPSNTEKLMSKSTVSHPYYFNLNDMWSDNWFNQQREKEKSVGINELPDGSYVADFDDLPKKSKQDVQNSFNDI